jgi:hypothetical protein
MEFCPICDPDEEEEGMSIDEWCWHVGFHALLWSLLVGLTMGIAGLSFYGGVWGFVNGITLLR